MLSNALKRRTAMANIVISPLLSLCSQSTDTGNIRTQGKKAFIFSFSAAILLYCVSVHSCIQAMHTHTQLRYCWSLSYSKAANHFLCWQASFFPAHSLIPILEHVITAIATNLWYLPVHLTYSMQWIPLFISLIPLSVSHYYRQPPTPTPYHRHHYCYYVNISISLRQFSCHSQSFQLAPNAGKSKEKSLSLV